MSILDYSPDRIGVAGDWHANTLYALDALDYFANREIKHIVHLGDFGYNFEYKKYLKPLNDLLQENGQHLWFVDGNHENQIELYKYKFAADQTRPLTDRITHLPRGFRWTWSGTSMLALGGAFSIDKSVRVPGIEWWPEEEINWDEAERTANGGHADIMFTHDCPAGVDIPDIRRNPLGLPAHVLNQANNHRNLLRQVVDAVKPKKLYHGHYHTKYESKLYGDDYETDIQGLDCDGTPLKLNTLIVPL